MRQSLYYVLPFLFLLGFSSCQDGGISSYSDEETKAESDKANAYFDKVFDEKVGRSPVWQSYLGIKDRYSEWDDNSEKAQEEEVEFNQQYLTFLRDSINYDALDNTTKVSYQLFEKECLSAIESYEYRHYDYPVNQMFGTHTEIPSFLINTHQVDNYKDAMAYLNRLERSPIVFSQLITGLKARAKKGVIAPTFVFDKVISDCENLLKGYPMERGNPENLNALYEDFQNKLNKIDSTLVEDQKKTLLLGCEKRLMSNVFPSYQRLIKYLKELKLQSNDKAGVWKFANGDKYFNYRLRKITTTNLTADEIHEIGLKEVARIHEEMKKIMTQVKFEGDLQAFFEFMRTDKQFFYDNTEEGKAKYKAEATALIDVMRTRLDDLFNTKPKADIVVKAVEPFREASAGKAFYQDPAPDGSRPGTYYVNLYDMSQMPTYQKEALAYHEGIPGHHMQLSIAQEMETLPKFRRYGGNYTAYIEGWALYSEFVPKEMGFYSDPYSDFGRLAMELWRACRLVVDTGIHAKKWTREEGIKYYSDNTPNPEMDCVKMVERHIVMPGQATAYKIGMIKILELRQKAKDALGDKFDIKDFHDVLLVNGALPLDVLENLVDDYIGKDL